MRSHGRVTPEGEGALQTMRQMLSEVQSLNNPIVAATAAMIVGIAFGFALSSLLASRDNEIKRLRADADDLKQRIDKLSS